MREVMIENQKPLTSTSSEHTFQPQTCPDCGEELEVICPECESEFRICKDCGNLKEVEDEDWI
jgi:predicted amidophosphoribosyltransferase